jgi:hypothetical protein
VGGGGFLCHSAEGYKALNYNTQKPQTDTGNNKSDTAETKAKTAKPGAAPILQKLQTESLPNGEKSPEIRNRKSSIIRT